MTSKLSLYDFFAMIIPGGIIMAVIWSWMGFNLPARMEELCCGCKVIVENDLPGWMWTVFVIVSYFIGLINNWINESLFRLSRNDRSLIANEMLRVVRLNGNIHLGKFGGNRYDCSKKPLYCLPYAVLLSIGNALRGLSPCHNPTKNPIDYYKAYYALSKKNLLGSIPILEAQVALVRNCLIPIGLFTCYFSDRLSGNCIYAIIIMVILLFIVMVQRQNKIYQMVWEAANYYEL